MNNTLSDPGTPPSAAAAAPGESSAPGEALKPRTAAEIKKEAEGQWHFIFSELAPQLSDALNNAPEHVACPHHGGSNGFRFFEHYNQTGRSVCNTCGVMRSGLDTLMLATGWRLSEAMAAVDKWLGAGGRKARDVPAPAPVALKPKVDPDLAYKRIREVLLGSVDIGNTPAERYLANRGIWLDHIPSTLRAHPGLPYVHIENKVKTFYGKFPCLLAPIRDVKRNLVSLHRIFVTPEGFKAPVPDAKKMMSQCRELRGAAIQLYPAVGDTLGVAEGIETALAVHAVTRMPTWACVSAVLMEQVEVPKHVKRVVIWADRDVSERGLQAASKLAERLEAQGIVVEVHLPYCSIPQGEKGIDWLDVMLKQGMNGFPAHWRRWRPHMTLEN